jgi:RimJ/RimL family protein N-acetyltransferase
MGLGRVVDGELVGVVGFNGYNGASIQMHMAGDGGRWITRKLIREAFRYAFKTCGCEVVFGMVPSGNRTALDIDLRLGFQEVAVVPDAHPDGALHILAMRRDECRWLR